MSNGEITKLAKYSARLIQMLGDQGANFINYTNLLAGSIRRTIQSKLRDDVTVKDYGAVGDGVADDISAIVQMAATQGYVIFPAGSYSLPSSLTISVPTFFREGSSLFVGAGTTLIIENRVSSPNQWIFQGTGTVQFRINNTGEDSQSIHAGWFGVFPANTTVTDVTARLQRALSSLSTQTREGIVQVECGSYHVSATMTVPRGVRLAGRGTRRTVFDVSGPADFPIFVTGGNACKFSDFQFEYPSAEAKVRTAPYIHVLHNTCEINDLWLFPSTVGIIVDSTQCSIRNLQVTYGLDPKSLGILDTSLIWVRSGAFFIDNVLINNTSFFPHHIVRVGHNITVGNGMINNIQSTSGANHVFFDARAGSITRVETSNVVNNASATTQFEGMIKVMAGNAFTVSNLTLCNIVGNSFADSLLHVEALDTSIISNISIGCASLQGSGGYGFRFLNAAGSTIRDIFIGTDVDVSARTNRMQKVGVIGFIGAPPTVMGSEFQGPQVLNHQIADDTAFILDINRTTIFSGILIVGSSNPAVGGTYSFRAATTSNHITAISALAAMATVITPLTGTTGADAKFTIGIDSAGKLVFENRMGASLTVTIAVLAGT